MTVLNLAWSPGVIVPDTIKLMLINPSVVKPAKSGADKKDYACWEA